MRYPPVRPHPRSTRVRSQPLASQVSEPYPSLMDSSMQPGHPAPDFCPASSVAGRGLAVWPSCGRVARVAAALPATPHRAAPPAVAPAVATTVATDRIAPQPSASTHAEIASKKGAGPIWCRLGRGRRLTGRVLAVARRRWTRLCDAAGTGTGRVQGALRTPTEKDRRPAGQAVFWRCANARHGISSSNCSMNGSCDTKSMGHAMHCMCVTPHFTTRFFKQSRAEKCR